MIEEAGSDLNSINVDNQVNDAASLRQTNSTVSQDAQQQQAVGVHLGRSRKKPCLPRIPLGMFKLSSSPSSSPPPVPQSPMPQQSIVRNGLNLALTGRPHRPVVRSQSSRVSLLRQAPASASSFTSGSDVEQHFPMPDKYVEFRTNGGGGRPWWCWCPLTVLLSTATVLLALWLCHLYGWITVAGRPSAVDAGESTCTSPACIRAAARLLARINPSIDPCTDFYQFSCGRFLDTTTAPDDSNQLSTLQEMQDEMLLLIRKVLEHTQTNDGLTGSVKKVKDFYASCMGSHPDDADYGPVSDLPVFAFFQPNELGAWPLLGPAFLTNDGDNVTAGDRTAKREEHSSLEHLMGTLAAYQVHSFVDIYVTQEERNASQYVIQFYKGEPLMDKEWYDAGKNNETADKHSRYLRSYRNLMEETILLLSEGRRDRLAELDDLLAFETQFARATLNNCADGDLMTQDATTETNHSISDEEELDTLNPDSTVDQRLNISDMESQFPAVNWTAVVETLLRATGMDEDDRLAIMTGDMSVSVQCRDYLADLNTLLNTTPKRIVANYMVWRFVFKMMPLITTRLQRMWTHFKLSVPNLSEERIFLSRWKQCISLVNEGFGLVAAHLYVNRLVPRWTNTWILRLIDDLKKALGESIFNQEWVEEEMTQRLLDKLEAMGAKIGYPSKILNLTQLDFDYDELHIDDGHVLFNVMRIRRHEVLREIKKIFDPPPKEKDWLVQPLVVNAFHNPSTNEIIIPLGILREPFFNLDLPKYMTYGNLGVVIGHEIIHGFDVNGRRYDQHGNMTMWWSDALMREFNQRADCFIRQYTNFSIDHIDKPVDGNRTLGENICDSGGLAHAWTAYKNYEKANGYREPRLPGVNYTADQLFFITYGQIWCEVLTPEGFEKYTKEAHSPGKYRANGVLQNSQTFAEVFQCPAGSPMNPEEKCQLWS